MEECVSALGELRGDEPVELFVNRGGDERFKLAVHPL